MHANFNMHMHVGGMGAPQFGSPCCGGGMMGNPLQQLMQLLMGILTSLVGGGMMNQMGGQCGMPMPFGNPGFGNMGGGCGCGGFGGPSANFLGGGGGVPFMGGGGPMAGAGPMGGFVPPSGQGGNAAVQTARQFLGQRSYDIRGRMPHFRAAGGLTNNCADFVSSALRSAGMLGGHEINCRSMEGRLRREGWVQIPASQAGPGDVAFNPSRGHVVLCQGNGMMIGSNNVRPGLQYVTEKRLPQNWVVYRKAGGGGGGPF